MKTYHYVALLVVVALIGFGYVMTVWMHGTLPQEHAVETASHNAVSESSVAAAGTPQAEHPTEQGQQKSDPVGTVPVAEVAESTGDETEETVSNTPSAPVTTQETNVTEPTASATTGLAVETQQLEPGTMSESFVQISIHALGSAIDLSGWSLSDHAGTESAGNVYYFNDGQVLQVGQTLTLNSACGRDTADTLYWCLSHPLALLNAEHAGLFFYNGRGDLAFDCEAGDQADAELKYSCSVDAG